MIGLEQKLIDKINELNWRIEMKLKLNKAEKFVKKSIANAPDSIKTTFEFHFYAFRMVVDHLQLESGYANIPCKNMPIEYALAIDKFAPEFD
jgi:hypothetical protein